MEIKKIIARKIALGAITLFFLGMASGVMAQEDQPANMGKAQTAINQDSWESWKQDIKSRFQQIRGEADKIEAEAREKNTNDAGLKDAIDKFETAAKAFSDKWSSADQVTPEKRDQFKTEISAAWESVKSAFDKVKSEQDQD